MKEPDPSALAISMDKREEKLHPRTLLNQHFRATVASIVQPSGGGPGNLQVQVQRVGETQPDGNLYPWTAATPPIVGQDVVLTWEDDKVAHADVALQQPGTGISRMYRTGAINPTGASVSIIGMDSVDFDGLGIAQSTGIQGFLVAAPGTYVVRGRASVSSGVGIRLYVAVFQNGSEVRRGYDNTATGPHGGPVSSSIECSVGDSIQLAVFVGATVGLEVGIGLCYLEVEWKA
jgi:hypothetical protein